MKFAHVVRLFRYSIIYSLLRLVPKINIETLPQVSLLHKFSSNSHQLMYFFFALFPQNILWCHSGNQFPQMVPAGMKMSPFPLISISQQVHTD